MKAVAIAPSIGRLALVETERPRIKRPTDALVKILEVGICGTDREIASLQYGTPPHHSEHLVLGHESLGEVVEVGSAVTTLRPGDLVVTMVRRPCGLSECTACASGRQDFCSTGGFVERGIKHAHGFMTEFIVDDAQWMVKLPKELRDVGVLVEPLTIAEKALAELAVVQQRLPWTCPIERGSEARHSCHRAVVIGAGPVGLLGAMALRNAGFETTVYSRDKAPNARSKVVEAIGARYVSSSEATVQDLAGIVGGIDVVYEAVGASQVAFDVLSVLGVNGMFIFTGVPARKGPIQIDSDLLMRNIVLKNQVVLGSVNAGKVDFEAAIADLTAFKRRWPDAVRALITGRHPVESFEQLLVGRVDGIKNVLSFAGAAS